MEKDGEGEQEMKGGEEEMEGGKDDQLLGGATTVAPPTTAEPPKMTFINPFEVNSGDAGAGGMRGAFGGEGKIQVFPSVDLTPDQADVLEKLKEQQKEYDDLEDEYQKEIDELELKYSKRFEGQFEKRYEILKDGGLPAFWVQALKNSTLVAQNITPRDEEALKHLVNISTDNAAGEGSFKLKFTFSENPYFENEELTKEYQMEEDDPSVLVRAIGCKVNWKAGKDLTKRVMKKKVKTRGGKTSTVSKTENCDSFFHLFAPPQMPDQGDDSNFSEREIINEILEADYEIGERLRTVILPKAVRAYQGLLSESEDEEYYDDEDDELYEDEEFGSDD